MREMSVNSTNKNDSQEPIIRGGDKKVMKKGLSLIVAVAMTFSTFASVAFAAEPAMDAQAKFDALKAKGIFDGYTDGSAGLDREMSRAEYTAVITKLLGLKKDSSKVSYKDTATHWAQEQGYIEAVTNAKIMDGVADGMFSPEGKVTIEQLATIMVRAYGLKVDNTAKVDGTVSDWAKGYVAAAIKAGLIPNMKDFTINAKRDVLVNATYVASSMKPAIADNGKVGIYDLQATDANQLTVQLGSTIDDKVAKITVKLADSEVTVKSIKYADDKKSAVITVDGKLMDGTYTVTLSGVTNLDSSATTKQVAVTKERIAKIEFLNATDTLPRTSNKLKIEFAAYNQYGKKSALSASNFSVYSSNANWTAIAGEQAIYLEQPQDSNYPAEQKMSKLDKNDKVSITVIHEDSGTQANKIFNVGDIPMVSKIEAGDLYSATGSKIDSIDTNSYAYLDIKAYDQYGVRVLDKYTLNRGVSVVSPDGDLRRGEDQDENNPFVDDTILDTAADLKLRNVNGDQAKDITVTLFANGSGQSITKVVKLGATAKPADIAFGTYTGTLAEQDTLTDDADVNKKMYIPLVIKDAKGTVLTPQQIVDAYNDKEFTIYSNGGIQVTDVQTSGPFKGYLRIASVTGKGSASVTIGLSQQPLVKATTTLYVGEVRKVDSVKFSTMPKAYMLPGADNEVKVKVYDQYGGELKQGLANKSYTVRLTYSANQSSTSSTDLTSAMKFVSREAVSTNMGNGIVNPYDAGINFNDGTKAQAKYQFQLGNGSGAMVNGAPTFSVPENNPSTASSVTYSTYMDFVVPANTAPSDNVIFDKGFKFLSSPTVGLTGVYQLKVSLFDADHPTSAISEINRKVELLDPRSSSNTKITYSAYLDKGLNNTVLAGQDFIDYNVAQSSMGYTSPSAIGIYNAEIASNSITGVDKFKSDGVFAGTSVSGTADAAFAGKVYKRFAKEIKVKAVTQSGDEIAVGTLGNSPTAILNATSSNNLVAQTVKYGSSDATMWLVGWEAGTATVSVVFGTSDGAKTSTIDVTAKNEAPVVKSITAVKSANTVSLANLRSGTSPKGTNTTPITGITNSKGGLADAPSTQKGLWASDASLMEKITVKDQYGDEIVSERAFGLDSRNKVADNFLAPEFGHTKTLGLTYYISDLTLNYVDNSATSTTTKEQVVVDSNGFVYISAGVNQITGGSFVLNILAPSGATTATTITLNP